MYRVLKPGGMLVVDHRNYDRMLDEGFSTKHEFYYTGDNVEARPVELSRTKAKFEYSFADGEKHQLTRDQLKQGYVGQLLQACGFGEKNRYGAFHMTINVGHVPFFTETDIPPTTHHTD